MPVAAKYGTAMIIKIVPIQPSPIRRGTRPQREYARVHAYSMVPLKMASSVAR
jgi:hypothetical protein